LPIEKPSLDLPENGLHMPEIAPSDHRKWVLADNPWTWVFGLTNTTEDHPCFVKLLNLLNTGVVFFTHNTSSQGLIGLQFREEAFLCLEKYLAS
jgi:hypothetical protein